MLRTLIESNKTVYSSQFHLNQTTGTSYGCGTTVTENLTTILATINIQTFESRLTSQLTDLVGVSAPSAHLLNTNGIAKSAGLSIRAGCS